VRHLLLLIAALAGAADDLKSGPAVGDDVADLKVFAVTGADAGKDIDIASARAQRPTVYLFVQSERWDRPVARFLKAIDTGLPGASAEAAAVAVWLTDKPDDAKDYLPRAQQSLKFQATTLTVFTGEKGGPAEWNVNGTPPVTAVVVNRRKVVATFVPRSVNEKDAAGVIDAVRAAVGAK